MKILFVTDLCRIKEDEKGLPDTLLNFISDFKSLGCEVVLFRPNVILNVLLRGRKILPEGEYNFNGIKCINKNYLTPFFCENQFKFLKNEKFDVILSHMPSGILAANKISKILNIPYFASVHASDIKVLSDVKYSIVWYAMLKAYKEAKMILPRSIWLKNEIEKIIKDTKTALVPSGIEKEAIINQSEIKKYGMPYKIFSAGSLIKRKNFKNLIQAASNLDIELNIAGFGPEEKSLLKLIKKNKKENKIKLLGKKNKHEIYKLMDEADIFVLISLKETFGMVYLEAMARGKIVVCTENSGMSGFIKDGVNGFLTKPDIKSTEATLKRILNSSNLAEISKNALNTAKNMERIKMAENYLKNISV